MQLIRGIGDSIVRCLVVVAFAILIQYTAQAESIDETMFEASRTKLADDTIDESSIISLRHKRSEEDDESVIRGNTPVWLAESSNYFVKQKEGLVGEIIDKWLTQKKQRKSCGCGRLNESKRVNQATRQREVEENFRARRSPKRPTRYNVNSRTVESNRTFNVVYPRILVVLDFNRHRDSNASYGFDYVTNSVLYATAFFNDVKLRLRSIKEPRIAPRISGIIINNNSSRYGAFPYMNPATFENSSELTEMDRYWKTRRSARMPSSPAPRSYDIVIHIIERKKGAQNDGTIRKGLSQNSIEICDRDNFSNTIKIWEDNPFDGVVMAMHHLLIVLGDKDFENRQNQMDSGVKKEWPTISMLSKSSVRRSLEKAQCLAYPSYPIRRSKLIPTILPGQIYSIKKQCQTSMNRKFLLEECDTLWCPIPPENKFDGKFGTVITGTPCRNVTLNMSGICLEGQCVKDQWTKNQH